MKYKKSAIYIGTLVLLLAVAGTSIYLFQAEKAREAKAGEAEYPTALAEYLEKQREAAPGPEEGPGSAAEIAFQQRAYPADTISVAQMNNAAAAFEATKGRPFPSGKGRPGTWVSVGPNEALSPGTPFRPTGTSCPVPGS